MYYLHLFKDNDVVKHIPLNYYYNKPMNLEDAIKEYNKEILNEENIRVELLNEKELIKHGELR